MKSFLLGKKQIAAHVLGFGEGSWHGHCGCGGGKCRRILDLFRGPGAGGGCGATQQKEEYL
jgi:hypothetical protein